MNRILVKRSERPPRPPKVLVVGVPGLGLVGATAARMLLSTLDGSQPRLISSFYPYVFLRSIRSSALGTVMVQGAKIRYRSLSQFPEGLLILTASSQPSLDLQHEFAWAVINDAKLLGCEMVITLAGYQSISVVPTRRVYFCSNDLHSYKVSSELGLETFEGPITGAAGVFAGIGRLSGLSGGCMLGETGGATPDMAAASAVVSALMAFLRPEALGKRYRESGSLREKDFLDSLS